MALGNQEVENALIGGTALYVKNNGGIYTKLPIQTTSTITAAGVVNAGAQTITSNSANALAVGANGTTNPQLNVDASVSSVATGLNVQGKAAASGLALSVLSSGTNENLTIDAKGSGTISLNVTGTGAIVCGRRVAVTSTGSNAVAVGANGSINPVLNIDASTASVATGINVKGAAAAGGVAVAALSSATDENLTIDSKGSGTLTLNGTATGNVVLGRAATGISVSVTGALTSRSATAVAAAASVTPAFLTSSTALLGMYFGTGSPNTALTAAKGSLYMRTDGSTTNDRAYINTDGSTAWTAITTAA